MSVAFVKTKVQEISFFPTHNLEVLGSSPRWPTDYFILVDSGWRKLQNKNANCLKNKYLAFCIVLEPGLEPARRLNAQGF